jgi:hypothetical protein
MDDWKINLSDAIANGEAYNLEAPLPMYTNIARRIQIELAPQVSISEIYDEDEHQFRLTDRVTLESVLLSQDNEEVYIFNHKMYVAEHSDGDAPTIGHYYYGTLYPSIAVIVDGIEVGRSAESEAIVKIAVDAITCTIAKPSKRIVPIPSFDPSNN